MKHSRGYLIFVGWVVSIMSFGYMLPWGIAIGRNLPNQWQILVVNFFLGWTVIGWVICLAWSLQARG